MNPPGVLRKLIRGCVDDERTLLHESKLVEGAGRAEALQRLARERAQFVEDLERLARGEEPHDGSWAELLREAGRAVRVMFAGRNDADAIRTCHRSRARTQALYCQALRACWSEEIRRVLAAQQRRLHDETDELDELR